MPDDASRTKSVWIEVGKQILSAAIAVGAVIFFFGGREAKINDIVTWKTETAPKIQRMDSQGTLSFDLFHQEYERAQARQEKKMEQIEERIRDLERNKP